MKVLLTHTMESASLSGESGPQKGTPTNTALLLGAGLGVWKSW